MVLQALADRHVHGAGRERCHVCGANVVVKKADEIVIKNAILRVDGATRRVSAKCSRCKAWVAVPLTYTG